jgi:glycosyltransferase involved in cell wall biosynthesis
VDALVVADGPYEGGGLGASRDGLAKLIARYTLPTHYVPLPNEAWWPNQRAKRGALLQAAAETYPGALLLILDADETVMGAETLRDAPEGDVLWLDVESPMYKRPYSQPRGIRAVPGLNYQGRHHWLYAGDRLLATHQYGGTGVEHRRLSVRLRNNRGLGHSPERAQVKRQVARMQFAHEANQTTGAKSDGAIGAREALRILAVTTYDAGLVGFRLHTALNTTTPHVAAFGSYGKRNVFGGKQQYNLEDTEDLVRCRVLAQEADILHCHLDYAPMRLVSAKAHDRLVIHHHGSMYRQNHETLNAVDKGYARLRLVSNLELTQYGDGLHFLPNPVNVARYRRLRSQVATPHEAFRISHSPSKRDYKGTVPFLVACATLKRKGVNVEPVLIEKQPHAESLRIKATCDAAFDSFWLGIQCSGLEAAAMGLPVIAGDVFVAEKYRDWLGEVPYTYASNVAELEEAMYRLATDAEFYRTEAERVAAYTLAHHDDAAVAHRYLDLLDEAFHWRTELRVAA